MYTSSDLANAIKQGDSALVETILNSDPSLVNAKTEDGISMVMLAQYYGRNEIAKSLVAHNAQLDLFDAAALGDVDRASGWLAMQPQLANALSPDGFTALGLASFFGQLEVVNALLQYHADPNIASNNAMRVAPLHSAVAGNHYDVAAKLVEAGASVNAVQQDGFTPLMGAAQNGNAALTKFLLDHGADRNARTDKNAAQFADMTALDFANQSKNGEVVALLQ